MLNKIVKILKYIARACMAVIHFVTGKCPCGESKNGSESGIMNNSEKADASAEAQSLDIQK